MQIQAQSVSQLTKKIRSTIENNNDLTDIWIEGEISDLSQPRSGHIYFTLKDESTQISCAFFKQYHSGSNQHVEAGASVIAHGKVTFYEPRGNLQILIDFVQPAGMGALNAEFERRKQRLQEKGMFAEERKRALPRFPMHIGVVTSPTGAALRDIQTILNRRWPLAKITVYPTEVQGANAEVAIASAIRIISKSKEKSQNPEILIVARGGGAAEDLWAFNEEMVVEAVFASPVPVISGIGHETDTTLIDLVADIRAATPSAAAEIATPDQVEIQTYIQNLISVQRYTLASLIRNLKQTVESHKMRIENIQPNIEHYKERINIFLRSLNHNINMSKLVANDRLKEISTQLRTLSPKAVMKRGFTLTSTLDGRIITHAKLVKENDFLKIQWQDDSHTIRIESENDK